MKNERVKLLREIKFGISLIIIGLVLSGVTAFPLEMELKLLTRMFQPDSILGNWVLQVYTGIRETNFNYPFIAYGTDWLAYAHLVIAIAFIGPLRNPVRNIWVIDFGIISCMGIFPMAFIAGSIREIPLFHQIIDCLFGIVGLTILIPVKRRTVRLQQLIESE